MKKIFLAIGFILAITTRVAAAPTSEVVVTIPPLHSLVQGVMGDTGKAELLLDGNTSPHNFQLKPSQMAMLQQAGFVFYIGDGLETFLVRALETLPENVEKVAMAEQPGMTIREIREGGTWEKHDHSAHGHEEGEAHEHHEHEMVDSHIWLDPANAIVMIKAITKELSAAHPENRSIYKANALSMISEIEASDEQVKATLAPVKTVPFIVFHDAYQYYEKRYGLTAVGSIVLEPGDAASAKRLKELRQKVDESGAVCIFREPQFSDKLSMVVAEGTPAKVGTLDPIGAELVPGPGLYPALLKDLANDMVACLKK